ncbi:MAG TPA: hypothetical protein VIR59_09330 [Gaiellaceae bacterium]
MRLEVRAASSIASALPSLRVALLFGGVLLLAESVVLASTLFAGAVVTFVAGLVVGASAYRYREPRAAEAEGGAGPTDAAVLESPGSRPRPVTWRLPPSAQSS